MKYISIQTLLDHGKELRFQSAEQMAEVYERMPSMEIVKCKDCKHKPHIEGKFKSRFDIEFPDDDCPCQCEDGWYNWIPEDDWFCANAERKDNERT